MSHFELIIYLLVAVFSGGGAVVAYFKYRGIKVDADAKISANDVRSEITYLRRKTALTTA